MKNVFVIITPKSISTKTISPSGKTYTRTRTAQLYFCMINVFANEPLIMTTEQKSQAIFYTEQELKIVEKYLIDNEIQFFVKTVDNDDNSDDFSQHITYVKHHVRTSLFDFI